MSVITAQWSSGLFRVINVRGNRVLNDDDTLRMLQMTDRVHFFIAGSEIKGQGQTWTFNLESFPNSDSIIF